MSTVRSPGSSVSSYEFFSPTHSTAGDPSDESDGSYATLSEDVSSDDEIVLSLSDISSHPLSQRGDGTIPPTPSSVLSDGDYVLMSRPRTPSSSAASWAGQVNEELAQSFSGLALSRTSSRPLRSQAASSATSTSSRAQTPEAPRRRGKKKRAPAESPNSENSNSSGSGSGTKRKVRRREKKLAARAAPPEASSALIRVTPGGLGDRPIVDDVSEVGEFTTPSVAYEAAHRYVTAYVSLLHVPFGRSTNAPSSHPSHPRSVLSDPSSQSSGAKLVFLQALIIELGLCDLTPSRAPSPSPCASPTDFSGDVCLPALPHSVTAAQALLKSNVYLNVRDYLAMRTKGVEALRSAMHPSRSALMREIRNGRRAPLKWIKDSGLSVLLVPCYHR